MPSKPRDPQVYVNEYHNGAFVRSWDGVSECARHHYVSYDTIKCLIATGKPLYWEDGMDITFDLPADSPYRYEMVEGSESGRKVPVLVIDVPKAMSNDADGNTRRLTKQ